MKAVIWTIVILAALAGLAYGGRNYATRMMDTRALSPEPLGSATPADAGVPFSRVAIQVGDRTLIGWWVRARADSGTVAPAMLFLHGNRSDLSDYVELQRFLYRQGISSFVFDYSGFGASGGSPSLSNAVSDAAAAARAFSDSAGNDARKVAMGSALGATVLLQAIDSVQPLVSGVVIEGTDASVREAAVRIGQIPKFVAPLVEEIADNVAAAARVRVPLLAIHSYADSRVPFGDAQRIVAAVPVRAALVRHWRSGHSALLASSRPCDWAPVLAFVKDGVLPAARLDTTNACAAEARQLAEAAARADSAKTSMDSARTAGDSANLPVVSAGTSTSPQTKSTGTKTDTKTDTKAGAKAGTKAGTSKTAAPTKRPTKS